jgi:glutamate-ammonia-ligase adenylyltransferase
MGHLSRGDAEFLLQATTFFRALDHGVRVVTGRAEEKLPGSQDELEMLAELVHRWTGENRTADTLASDLSALQSKMRHLFENIFTH